MNETVETVLDASAILAVLNREPGADIVLASLAGSVISAITLTEVVANLADRGADEISIRRTIGQLGMRVIPFNDDRAYRAGLLRPLTRAQGLSLGDRACLALAQEYGLPALTSDRNWSRVTIDVDIRQIR